ncbi:MAG: enoyl-CoA hydratase family protein [Anaerolineae bacterium]
MSYDFLFDVTDRIATITLNRPDRLNSLTFEIYAQLRDLFAGLQYNDEVNVVVLTGAGKGFCSGGDVYDIIGNLFERDMRGVLEFTRMTGAVVQNMRHLQKPIIAAINGTAAGAGAVLAMASDLRVMSDQAKFAFLFTGVGLTGADMGVAHLLPQVVGTGRAMEILLLGDKISPMEADKCGLVNWVVPHEKLMDKTLEIARRLAEGPTLALGLTKRLIYNEAEMGLVAAIEQEAQAQALMLMGKDHRAFFEAFKEKRQPEFSGR